MPLAKGGGLPGLKGAKIQLIFADNQGTPAAGQNQTLRLITEEKVVAADRRLPVGHHAHRQRHRRALRHSVPHAGVGGRQPDRARLQVVLPHHAGRHRLRQGLFGLPQGAEGGRPEGRLDRLVHENTEYGNSVASVIAEHVRQGRPADHAEDLLLGQLDRRAAAGAAAQGEESRRPDLHLLHVGRDPLRQDHEGAELEARAS